MPARIPADASWGGGSAAQCLRGNQAEPRVLGDALPPHADGLRAGASPPPLCGLGCVIPRSGPQFPLPRGLMQEGFKSLLFFF